MARAVIAPLASGLPVDELEIGKAALACSACSVTAARVLTARL